jgi:hypothetical protein
VADSNCGYILARIGSSFTVANELFDGRKTVRLQRQDYRRSLKSKIHKIETSLNKGGKGFQREYEYENTYV